MNHIRVSSRIGRRRCGLGAQPRQIFQLLAPQILRAQSGAGLDNMDRDRFAYPPNIDESDFAHLVIHNAAS